MDTIICIKCKKNYTAEEIIKTDEFSNMEVRNYCSSCFIDEVKNGFGHYEIGKCTICDNNLVLQFDDEETINLAKEDFTVHFICKKLKDIEENIEFNNLNENKHDELILYTIQPS
jgi:hypothetical protein